MVGKYLYSNQAMYASSELKGANHLERPSDSHQMVHHHRQLLCKPPDESSPNDHPTAIRWSDCRAVAL